MAEMPVELKNSSLNSWSHLNSDAPVLHKHGLKISRFQQCLDQYECGNCIQDKFVVNVKGKETNWELRIYPNGYEEETGGFLALFVKHKESINAKYLIKSNICILDNNGQKRVHCELPGKALSSKQMHGTKKYIQRDQLMSDNKIYFDDSVTFLLEAEICLPDTKVSFVESVDDAETVVMEENKSMETEINKKLKLDLGELLKSSDHSDVTIKCQEQSLPCHKAILAGRSPVFAAMFSSGMTESQSNEVNITDLEPGTVKLMLQYIYSGAVSQDIHSMEDLIQAADKYELVALKQACELALTRALNISNCLDYLILSDLYSAEQLQKACLKFTVKHLSKVMATVSWKSKLSSHPTIMALILQETAKDNERKAGPSSSKKRRKELTSFSSLFSESSTEEED